PMDLSAERLVGEAMAAGCTVLCAGYNEPMIAAEWVHAVFALAKRNGLTTALISDGNATPESLSYMKPVSDVLRVELKGYGEQQYHGLEGQFEGVLASIREASRLRYWVEVVTTVVPGFNDDMGGLSELASELYTIDPVIPWHIHGFVPRDCRTHRASPEPLLLMSVAGMAYARGLKFAYVGNASNTAEFAHTRCPGCHQVVIHRHDHRTLQVRLNDGACPQCKARVPGVFTRAARPSQRLTLHA
ncbi:MAG TPA: radical SAM protein, partial [Polyangiaceae bacterium]|nr:radical SAM protein [Polyangiaceae bacterium]